MERSEAIEVEHGVAWFVPVLLVGLLLGGAAFWGANKQILGLFHDDGIYTVVGKSLADGDGYRIISLPTAPPQTKYPFLFSSLVGGLWKLESAFPQNIALLKSLNVATFIGIYLLAVVYYRQEAAASNVGAIIFGLLVCANPIVFSYTDFVLSDLLLVLWVLIGLTWVRSPSPKLQSFSHFLWLGVICGAAMLTRSAAAPLVFAGLIYASIGHGARGAGTFLLAAAVLVTPWQIWLLGAPRPELNSLFAYYAGYDLTGGRSGELARFASEHLAIVWSNARFLLDSFDLLYLLPLLPGLGLFVFTFTMIGMITSIKRSEIFLWSFFLSSVALLLVWPFQPTRYMAPLVPILMLFFFRGMKAGQLWIETKSDGSGLGSLRARLAWCPVLGIFLVDGVWLSSYLLIRDDQTTRAAYGRRLPFGWSGFQESFAWIRANTRSEDLLATAYDPMYYLYTGRRAIRPALHRPASYFYPYGAAKPDVGTVDDIKPQLARLKVKYLIADPLDGYAEGAATLKLIDQLVDSYGNRAAKVFTSSDGKHRIYRLGLE